MTQTAQSAGTATPWRFFATEVSRTERLSPHFLRVTFTGDDLDRIADNGFDQRIKLILPTASGLLDHMPTGDDWYAEWRGLPDELRNPIRTYTVRAVRPARREVDVDMVLHEISGPASWWAAHAGPGSRAWLLGPNADHDGPHGGVDFRPPGRAAFLLMGGDETAVPAISSILAGLPGDAVGEALLEVPSAEDVLRLSAPAGVRVSWLPRDGAAHGERLTPGLRAVTRRVLGERPGEPIADLDEPDVDRDVLWEVPEPVTGAFYAWLAGEAAVIRTLRRHLVGECGVDRRSVAFMGYWRLGRSEDY